MQFPVVVKIGSASAWSLSPSKDRKYILSKIYSEDLRHRKREQNWGNLG